MFDVCVIGHVTRDIVRRPRHPDRETPGGTAYYSALALARFGVRTAVCTKVAGSDRALLLEPLERAGVTVFTAPSRATTVFENTYAGDQLESRTQRLLGLADPFTRADVQSVAARAVHLGPLTRGDLSADVMQAARGSASILALDGQGMVRRAAGDHVEPDRWADAASALAGVDILKVDRAEAAMIVEAESDLDKARDLRALGAREVLLTFADRGSLVMSEEGVVRVDGIPPPACVDATGCGDTYAAGYLVRRLAGDSPEQAAWFGAAAASLKLAVEGAFTGDEAAVRAHLDGYRRG